MEGDRVDHVDRGVVGADRNEHGTSYQVERV